MSAGPSSTRTFTAERLSGRLLIGFTYVAVGPATYGSMPPRMR